VPRECGAGTEPARPVSFAATGWRAIVQTIWAYLIRLTASRAGIAQADAERQVDEAIMGATSLQLGGGRTAYSQVSRATRLT
jgi:hypothetical protein